MKDPLTIKRLRICFVVLMAAFISHGCNSNASGYLDGRSDARRDLAKGRFAIAYAEGSRVPEWTGEYRDLLWKKTGVSWRMYSLPLHPNVAEARARGYNEVLVPAIQQRFGTNMLNQLMAEARKQHEEKIKRFSE